MAKKKTERIIQGKPLIPNAGIRAMYAKELDKLTSQMDSTMRREILKIWKEAEESGKSIEAQERIMLNKMGRYYTQLWKDRAKELAEGMVGRQNRSVASSLRESLKSFGAATVVTNFNPVKTNTMSKTVLRNVRACINENVNYIKSIQSEYFTKIEGAVYRGIINGQGYGEIRDALLEVGIDTKRRARNIAKDQAHKTYEAIGRARMEEAGLQYWQWEHGGGTKTVRPNHIRDVEQGGLNHSIHKIGEKAWDEEAWRKNGKFEGQDIYPGELPFCSCRMRPVIKFDE